MGGMTPWMTPDLLQAAEQSESQYVNLQLHTLSLREEPAPPRQVEVEYSTVVSLRARFPRHEDPGPCKGTTQGWGRTESEWDTGSGWLDRRWVRWKLSESGGS